MKTLRLLISIFFLLNSLDIFGQEKAEEETYDSNLLTFSKIIPPGPNAASLGKYGETPVSLFNGRVDISIPLWEIQTNSITLPISLSYDAGGLKVTEIPSWVGAGWSLNAGGVITRVVRGEPDDKYSTFAGYMYIQDIEQETNFSGGVNDNNDNITRLRHIAEGKLDDYQYDNFYFNFAGYSGKFHLKHNHTFFNNSETYKSLEFISIPYQAIKIEYKRDYVFNQIGSFKVTTPDGLRYFFTEREVTSTISSSHNIDLNAVNSWYLTKIIGLNNDTISFEYDDEKMYRKLIESTTYQECLDTTGYGYTNTNIAFVSVQSPRLSKIISPDQILLFKENSYARNDIKDLWDNSSNKTSDCKALDTIKIYARDNYETNPKPKNYFKSFVFVSNYEIGGGKRLTLNSVYEKTEHNQMPAYQFFYHNIINFPSFGEALKKEDYWGFYKANASMDVANNLPKIKFINGTSYIYKNENGTDKFTDTSSVKNGTLEKIIYPTKGYTIFEYEPNIVEQFSQTCSGLSVLGKPQTNNASASVSTNGNSSTSFSIEDSGDYTISYSFSCSGSDDDYGGGNGNNGGGNGDGIYSKTSYDENFQVLIDNISRVNYGKISSNESVKDSTTVHLSDGDHTLKIKVSNNVTGYASVSYTYTLQGNSHSAKISDNKVGGVRIKKISDYSAEGKLASEREYKYSDGKIFTIPVWFRRYTVRKHTWQNTYSRFKDYKCLQINSNKAGFLNTVQGGYVGYGEVRELKTSADGTKIKTIKHFNNVESPQADVFPFLPTWQSESKVGKLKDEIFFSGNKKIKEISYEYFNEIKDNVQGFIAGEKLGGYANQDNSLLEELFDFRNYFSHSYMDKLKLKKTTEYFEGNKELMFQENYEYNEHGFLSKIETIETNNNKTTKIEKIYASDISDSPLVPSGMTAGAWMLSPLVEQSTSVNNKIIDKQTISYKKKSNKYLPDVMRKQKINSPEMYDHTHFSLYDEYGNITEYYPTDDYKTSLLWGYNYSKVIAKIENKSYEEVMEALNINYEDLQTKKGEELKTLMDNLRNHETMKDARITSYQYDTLLKMLSEQTDLNGNSVYYKYDEFGRLKYVIDQNGNIVKIYEYHFKNMN